MKKKITNHQAFIAAEISDKKYFEAKIEAWDILDLVSHL